jgi:hypothetical protein
MNALEEEATRSEELAALSGWGRSTGDSGGQRDLARKLALELVTHLRDCVNADRRDAAGDTPIDTLALADEAWSLISIGKACLHVELGEGVAERGGSLELTTAVLTGLLQSGHPLLVDVGYLLLDQTVRHEILVSALVGRPERQVAPEEVGRLLQVRDSLCDLGPAIERHLLTTANLAADDWESWSAGLSKRILTDIGALNLRGARGAFDLRRDEALVLKAEAWLSAQPEIVQAPFGNLKERACQRIRSAALLELALVEVVRIGELRLLTTESTDGGDDGRKTRSVDFLGERIEVTWPTAIIPALLQYTAGPDPVIDEDKQD